MNHTRYTITAFASNHPGILYRVSELFMKRKINIDSMTVSQTEVADQARFTITVRTTANIVEKIVKQLYRIIEVSKVYESFDTQVLVREVAFIKVGADTLRKRQEVQQLASLTGAKVAWVTKDALVLELAGNEEEIDTLIQLVTPLGIKESVRSGRVALRKI